MEKLIILGAGNYGYVTREVALSTGVFSDVIFLDDNNQEACGKFDDYEKFVGEYNCAFVAIGNPVVRKIWFDKLSLAGFNMVKLISPHSYISPSSKISCGVIIEPQCVVNTDVSIKEGCLICAGAILNHNSIIGEFSQIDCGAVVGANAVVSPSSKINYNEVVIKR